MSCVRFFFLLFFLFHHCCCCCVAMDSHGTSAQNTQSHTIDDDTCMHARTLAFDVMIQKKRSNKNVSGGFVTDSFFFFFLSFQQYTQILKNEKNRRGVEWKHTHTQKKRNTGGNQHPDAHTRTIGMSTTTGTCLSVSFSFFFSCWFLHGICTCKSILEQCVGALCGSVGASNMTHDQYYLTLCSR